MFPFLREEAILRLSRASPLESNQMPLLLYDKMSHRTIFPVRISTIEHFICDFSVSSWYNTKNGHHETLILQHCSHAAPVVMPYSDHLFLRKRLHPESPQHRIRHIYKSLFGRSADRRQSHQNRIRPGHSAVDGCPDRNACRRGAFQLHSFSQGQRPLGDFTHD